jgi:hypothetical protein
MSCNQQDDVATTDDCFVALQREGGALDEHYGACEKVFGGQHNDLGAEARTRVSQIIRLLTEVGRYLMIGIEAQTLQNEIGAQLSAGQATNNGMSECSPRR